MTVCESNLRRVHAFCREDEEILVGDEVATTTSEFPYNSLTHSFDNEAVKCYVVLGERIGEDYSEFVAEKSTNGGCYGFDYFKVVEVLGILKRD